MPDVPVPLGRNAWKRTYAGAPEIKLINRFFETNPANLEDQAALLARQGSTSFTSVGDSLHRGKFSQAGFMNGDLFVADDDALFRVQSDKEIINITGELLGEGNVAMAPAFGVGYQHLFIADGLLLQLYRGGTLSTGTLTETGTIASQVIRIGDIYYTWGNSAAVSANADGTVSDPWVALVGADDEESLVNMEKLINFSGIRGATYSANLGGPNTQVTAVADTNTLEISSRTSDTANNSIVTQVTSGSGLAWGAATLTGGGIHALSGVELPDGNGARAVAGIAGYVLVSQTDTDRFYWVNPGELVIDPLNFATAESQPDEIVDLVSTGDTAWLLGTSSSEIWYPTGQAAAPFAPIQGRAIQEGVIEGTAVRIGDAVAVVGANGVVYSLGGTPTRISHHGIEERIRKQLKRELSA